MLGELNIQAFKLGGGGDVGLCSTTDPSTRCLRWEQGGKQGDTLQSG